MGGCRSERGYWSRESHWWLPPGRHQGRGKDDILTAVVTGTEAEAIAAEMERSRPSETTPLDSAGRDHQSCRCDRRDRGRGTKSYGLNCGACGFDPAMISRRLKKRPGRILTAPMHDEEPRPGNRDRLGGKIASILMPTIGSIPDRRRQPDGSVTCRKASVIMGIPLSATGRIRIPTGRKG